MTTSIDTNVIVALWRKDHASNADAARLLAKARSYGPLIVCGPVFSELAADPQRTPEDLGDFLRDTGISVAWNLGEADWREAGRAYRGYAHRRWASSKSQPRRILADFLVGAHALVRNHALLTFDAGHYAAAFPKLKIISS